MEQATISYSRLLPNVAGIGANGAYAEFRPGDNTMDLATWEQVKDYPTVKNWLVSGDLVIYSPGLAAPAPLDDELTEPLLCDLNTASHDQLTQLKGIGDATASKLIELRTVKPFTSVVDARERLEAFMVSFSEALWNKALPYLTVIL